MSLIALAAALLALPGSAFAATRGQPLAEISTLQLPSPEGPHSDALIKTTARRLSRVEAPHDSILPVIGGQQVTLSSTYYGIAEMQSVVNVLGALVHGPEMSALSAYVATPDEINYICGHNALACYAPGLDTMVISGVDAPSYGVPRDYTIAHEYGHHIANHRYNAPWSALETGAKRWATFTRVCQGVRRGLLYPGDQDHHYWDNPGEGFAETNARLNYPGVSVPWGYSALLRPNLRSIARLRADIESPWSAQETVTWSGSVWPQRSGPAARHFATPLDGQVQIRLEGPAESNYDLFVLGEKLPVAKKRARGAKKHQRNARPRRRVLHRAVSSSSTEQLNLEVCGRSAIRIEVRRRYGSGPFTVSLTRP